MYLKKLKNLPSPINSVSKTSVTKMLAFSFISPSSPTVISVERFGMTVILSATPLRASIFRQHSAIGSNASQATMESAPHLAAMMERRPVPVPESNRSTSSLFTNTKITYE